METVGLLLSRGVHRTAWTGAACVWLAIVLAGCADAVHSDAGTTAAANRDASRSGPSDGGRPRQVTVAAAADLKFALDDLAAEFEQSSGVRVQISYGASGTLFAQLLNRAPFDMFLSADVEYPRQLIERGTAAPGTEFVYAVGRLVVWVPHGSPLDVDLLEEHGAEVLAGPEVRRLAIANPRHAPYGRAAEAALRGLGIHDRVKDRLVLGENVGQTAQFVDSGGADAGIISFSWAGTPPLRDKGRYWEIPRDCYPRMEQAGIVLPWARDGDAARMFRDFILSEEGQAILKRHGFLMPER